MCSVSSTNALDSIISDVSISSESTSLRGERSIAIAKTSKAVKVVLGLDCNKIAVRYTSQEEPVFLFNCHASYVFI